VNIPLKEEILKEITNMELFFGYFQVWKSTVNAKKEKEGL
jgi:hypothetical protein